MFLIDVWHNFFIHAPTICFSKRKVNAYWENISNEPDIHTTPNRAWNFSLTSCVHNWTEKKLSFFVFNIEFYIFESCVSMWVCVYNKVMLWICTRRMLPIRKWSKPFKCNFNTVGFMSSIQSLKRSSNFCCGKTSTLRCLANIVPIVNPCYTSMCMDVYYIFYTPKENNGVEYSNIISERRALPTQCKYQIKLQDHGMISVLKEITLSHWVS